MQIILFFLVVFLSAQVNAQTLQKLKTNEIPAKPTQTFISKEAILIPSGLLSDNPIISDATFAIIAKKIIYQKKILVKKI